MVLTEVERYDPSQISSIDGQAVVLGGSMAGLCAARTLSDAFERVIVVERDELSDEPVSRQGAPQTSHPHALLEAGRATLEDFFSGFGDSILSRGGLIVDAFSDIKWYEQGDFLADGTRRSPMYSASRPLFEYVVRQHVGAIETVEFRDACNFTDYLTDDGARSVTGVAYRDANGSERHLEADLVVDATGRASRTPNWLENNGYDRPSEATVHIDVNYSTIRIERPSKDRRIFFVPPSAPRTRGAFFIPIENNRWEVLMQGVHDAETPSEPGEVVPFLETIPVGEMAQLARSQPWISREIDEYPFPSNVRRHYEDLDRFPDGLLVTGDAIASFNPIYGQGMSVAALDALQLHHALAEGGRENLAMRFFDRAETIIDTVWQLAVGGDFEFAETTGPKPFGTDLSNRYLSRLIRRGHNDSVLRETIGRVLILEQPPSTLFHPDIMWRTLRPT